MRKGLIKYKKALKYIAEYMRKKYQDENYRYTEFAQSFFYYFDGEEDSADFGGYRWYGVITNENPLSKETIEKILEYTWDDEKREEAADYLTKNNIIYVYNTTVDDIIPMTRIGEFVHHQLSKRPHYNYEYRRNVPFKDLKNYIEVIDGSLYDEACDYIESKEEKGLALIRK